MKKILLIILASLLCFSESISAQTEPILVDIFSGTYELLENPISVNNEDIWEGDFNYVIDLDFEFEINYQVFNEVIITAGNGLHFQGYNNPRLWIWGSEWGGNGYLYDVGDTESESPIGYEVVGEVGERIVKIQWQNAGISNQWPDYFPDDPDDFVNFQMWIYEGSNELEVHYGPSQSSDSSFDQNDGPGVRFLKIDNNWGYCFSGYENLPYYTWTDFTDPVPGCLLNGIPNEGKIFRFYPNPTVLVKEEMINKPGFTVVPRVFQNNLSVIIDQFDQGNFYNLHIYNILGVEVLNLPITNKNTLINQLFTKTGIYVFVLMDGNNTSIQKVLLRSE